MCCMDLITSESQREIQYPDFMFGATVAAKCLHMHAWICVIKLFSKSHICETNRVTFTVVVNITYTHT